MKIRRNKENHLYEVYDDVFGGMYANFYTFGEASAFVACYESIGTAKCYI